MTSQKLTEFSRFLQLIGEKKCRSYLEIGSCEGQTFLAAACGMERAVSVDWPGKRWGRKNSAVRLRKRVLGLREKFGVDAQLVLGDSKSPEVLKKIRGMEPFDAIFIDGDHTESGVRADWENYRPAARKLIGFHDIYGEHIATRGVWKLWQEIKKTHETREFIETWGGRPMGIGVVLV